MYSYQMSCTRLCERLIIAIVSLTLVICDTNVLPSNKPNRLVLLLVDGFAGSYLKHYAHLDAINKTMAEGVWSDRVIPEFPSFSLPNHYSLATGLRPSKHGIVGNYMYDEKTRQYFRCATIPTDFNATWWTPNDIEPIWMTSLQQGVNTGLYHWPGCQVKFNGNGKHPTCFEHNPRDAAKSSLSPDNVKILAPAIISHQFSLSYFGEIDKEGHKIGPTALSNKATPQHEYHSHSIIQNSIERFNTLLGELIYVADFVKDLNILVVSDHGMIDVPMQNQRFLDNYLDLSVVEKVIDFGAVAQIIPVPGEAENIYSQLRDIKRIPNVEIYWTSKDEPQIDRPPARFDYVRNNRISELVLIAEPGYGIYVKSTSQYSNKRFPPSTIYDWAQGGHGYDPEHPSMAGIFFGYGPDFKRGYNKKSARIIDFAPLVCNMLNVTCQSMDGQLNKISDVLISSQSSTLRTHQLTDMAMRTLSITMLLFLYKKY